MAKKNNGARNVSQMSVEEMRKAVPGDDVSQVAPIEEENVSQISEEEQMEKAEEKDDSMDFQRAKDLRKHWNSSLLPILRRKLLPATLAIPQVKSLTEEVLKSPELQSIIMDAIAPKLEALYFGEGENDPDFGFRDSIEGFAKEEVSRLEELRRKQAEIQEELAAYGIGGETSAPRAATGRPGRPAAAKSSSTGTRKPRAANGSRSDEIQKVAQHLLTLAWKNRDGLSNLSGELQKVLGQKVDPQIQTAATKMLIEQKKLRSTGKGRGAMYFPMDLSGS